MTSSRYIRIIRPVWRNHGTEDLHHGNGISPVCILTCTRSSVSRQSVSRRAVTSVTTECVLTAMLTPASIRRALVIIWRLRVSLQWRHIERDGALNQQRLDCLLNTLRTTQNGRHFPDDIFKYIFLNENVWISIKISLKFVPKGPIDNIPALDQIMALALSRHYLNQLWLDSASMS